MKPEQEALPFDLRALEIFLAVCEHGTMVAAARTIGLTQPAVSQAIAELEARTGVALLDRSLRPLGLTPPGLMLRHHAASLLSEARQIAPLLRQGAGRLQLVRVGMVDSLQRAVLPALAAELAQRSAQAVFLSGLTASHGPALLTRQIDLFLGVDDLADSAGLERWPLIEEPYVLIGAPGIPPPADIEALRRLGRFVRYTARSRTGTDIERHLRRLRLELAPGQEFDTPYGVTEAVTSGQGWAISTPLCLHEAALAEGRVACHPLPGPGLRRRLTLTARQRELGPATRAIARCARAALADGAVAQLVAAHPWLAGQILIPD